MEPDFKAPWSIGGNEILGDHIYDADGQPVAIVDGLPHAERNGRLIKAAPDMYEVLAAIARNDFNITVGARRLIRDALAQVGAP